MNVKQGGLIHAILVPKIIDRSRHVKLRVFLFLLGLVMRSFVSRAQIGSGSSQASAHAQAEPKAEEIERSGVAPLFVGEALVSPVLDSDRIMN